MLASPRLYLVILSNLWSHSKKSFIEDAHPEFLTFKLENGRNLFTVKVFSPKFSQLSNPFTWLV
jgi:hypothetical protein